MSNVVSAKGETIQVSPRFFDPKDIKAMLDFKYSKLTVADAEKTAVQFATMQPSEFLGVEIAKDASFDEAFRKAIEIVEGDSELGEHIKKDMKNSEHKQKKMLENGIKRKIDEKRAKQIVNNFRLTEVLDDNTKSIYINDKLALSYDIRTVSAATASTLDTIVAWVKLVYDSICFIGMVIGIRPPRLNTAKTSRLTAVINKYKPAFQRFINALKPLRDRALAAKRKIEVFIDAWGCLEIRTMGKDIIKAIYYGASILSIAWAVVKFVAAIVLMFVSGGASLILKMIQAVAQLVSVIDDVIQVIRLETANA